VTDKAQENPNPAAAGGENKRIELSPDQAAQVV
jgi:hypothetical protein